MHVIELPVDLLKAAIVCCSTEEARYYLNGVHISTSGHIVSTDGHRMFVGKSKGKRLEASLIIPLDTIKKALSGFKRPEIDLTIDGASHTLGDIKFTPVDGTFPDWERLLPSGEGRECTPEGPENQPGLIQFNPRYYGDLGKIAKLLTRNEIGMCVHKWTASGPAGVSFADRDDALCVIMPMRGGNHGPWRETLLAVMSQ